MTLRSWKSRRITQWSTRLWSRLDVAAWTLALSLPLAPTAFGGDVLDDPGLAATAAVTQPAGTIPQETPAERWQRLKSRYQTETVTARVSHPGADSPGSTRPVPEAAPTTGWTPLQPSAAAPFPELTDAPPWIVASPAAAAPIAEPAAPSILATAPSQPAAVPLAPQPLDPFASQPPVDVTPRPESHVIAAGRRQPGELPPMPTPDLEGPRRSVRPITEISPYYDLTVDQDIRDYADQRAAEYNVKFGDESYQPRMFPDVAMAWEPTNFYHFPLYFEDPALERYGHTRSFLVQPFVSGARFTGQLLALPYQMTIDPIDKPVYALGWYRPGEVAPKLKYQVPFNAQAAAVEAAVVTGMFFLIP